MRTLSSFRRKMICFDEKRGFFFFVIDDQIWLNPVNFNVILISCQDIWNQIS